MDDTPLWSLENTRTRTPLECAHWLAYHSYKIDAQLTTNTIRLPTEIRLTSMQKVIIYGSGVFFTLQQGVIGFWLTLKKDSFIGFYILLSAAVFRWAAIIQGIFSSSDELKVSLAMGYLLCFGLFG